MTRYRVLAAASLAGFVAIALDVTHHGLFERHDARIGRWVVANTPHAAVHAAEIVTQVGSWWALVLMAGAGAVALGLRGRRGDALLLAGAYATVSLATNGLKRAFDRPRPSIGTSLLSFPSGHTSGATVVLVLLALFLGTRHRPALVAAAALLAGLVGVTRVVVQAHWTTDVLAGYCLGGTVVASALLLRERLSRGRQGPGLSLRPEREHDRRQSRHEEDDGAGRPLAEHRSHHLGPVPDLAEPRRR